MMRTLLSKHSTLLSLLLILLLFFIARVFPSTGIVLGVIFIIFSLVISVYMSIKKHRKAYLQGKISFSVMIRNNSLDITAVLLAMILAALLGMYLAEIATRHLGNDPAKLVVGIAIGLSVGMIVGLLIKRATVHLVKT